MLRNLGRAIAAGLLAWVVVGQTALLWFPGEVAVHWTLHAGVLLLVLGVALRRSRIWRAWCMAGFLLGLWPWLLAAWQPRAPVTHGVGMVIAHANLRYDNDDGRGRALDAVEATDADVISLVEAMPADRARLERDPRWPFQRWWISTPCGSALLSRFPMISVELHVWHGKPAIEAVLDVMGRRLRLFAIHPRSPTSPLYVRERDAFFAELAEAVSASAEPVAVIGDWNCTVASPAWRRCVAASGLRRPMREPATWPSWLLNAGITIDHLLVGDGVAIDPPRPLWLPGSDHRGIVARVAVLR